MALSSRYISEAIPAELWDRYSQMQTDMILAFAARARDLDYSAMWMADKLKAMGILREDLERIVAANWPGTQRDLAKTLDEAGFKSLSADERIYQRGVDAGLLPAAPPIAESVVLRRILESGYSRAINKLNLTNTTAVNTTIAALDEAYTMVNFGAVTLDVGIQQAVSGLAERGIIGAVYPSGRRMEMAPYVRMVIRTSVMGTTSDMGFARMDEYGSDLLVVSAHAGARPRCFPYQGRVYSRSGNHPRYPAWSTTSYGEAAGLLGINCGHFVDPFIEGLDRVPARAERDPARAELGKPNAEVYEESQEQRYYERKIREWKHREAAMKEASLNGERERQKVREWQARQRAFIEQTDRTRRYRRRGSGGIAARLLAH